MSRACIFKKNKNIEKGLQNRRRSLMKKADDTQRVYGIGVAVLMEIKGELFQYKSRTGLLAHGRPIPAKSQFSPANMFEGNDGRFSSATPSPKQTKPTTSQHATKERRKHVRRMGKSHAAALPRFTCPGRKEALRSVKMMVILAATYFGKKPKRVVAPLAGSSSSSDAE